MPRPRSISLSMLALQMQTQGVSTAQQLATALKVDRSTISRALGGLGERVVRFGAARKQRYALRREVRAQQSRWPIYRISESGRSEVWAELQALHGGYRVEFTGQPPAWLAHGYQDGFFPGLPFFLSDARPQGFLGRALAREYAPTNGWPEDPRAWQDDDILTALWSTGHDLPGNLVLGTRMMETLLRTHDSLSARVVASEARPRIYPERANQAMQGGTPGSSAGGEQPKFLASVRTGEAEGREVLVKFSPPMDTPSGQRWADLLTAEHHAAAVLRAQGDEAVITECLSAGGRRFLEVTRFDRAGSRGRRGVITLQAVEAGLIEESPGDWPAAALAMQRAGLLSAADAVRLARRWWFGALIANNDMHFGNTAVWFGDGEPFGLAPAYDMLPMFFAPGSHGEVVPREFAPLRPRPESREIWFNVLPWAQEFWSRVAADAAISAEFRHVAEQADMRLRQVAESL